MSHRRIIRRLAFPLAAMSLPNATHACEPIIPLAQLIGGSSLAGPALLKLSLTWLVIAVAIKSISFACLERRLSWPKAICFMLIANVLSTIPGALAAAFAGSGALTLFTLPIIFGFGLIAERRFSLLSKQTATPRFSGRGVAFAFTGAFFVSLVMFFLAGSQLDAGQFVTYWLLKLLFATIAVSTGMAISIVLEEYALGWLARQNHRQIFFFVPVIRANYITLGVVLLVTALEILPKRLAAPHFIVSWLQAVSSFLGLA